MITLIRKRHTTKKSSGILMLALMSLLAFCLLLPSCKTSNRKKEAKKLVAAWISKEIHFPDSTACNVLGKDTFQNLCEQLYNADYKVLLYVDSTGCSDCRLKLVLWKELIQESDSLFQGRLRFLFFIQPKKSAPQEIRHLLLRNHFDHPVFLDVDDQFNKQNNLPQNLAYQCFLLDKHNKVVLIGNPVLNPQIWSLYKEAMNKSNKPQATPLTTITIDKTVHDYGQIHGKGSNKATFTLKNKGVNPLVLYRVSASCGCTDVIWEKRPIMPNRSTTISVTLSLNEKGFFNKEITIYANTNPSKYVLRITGTIVDKL